MSLDPVAKERYRQKLKILGLDKKCDPYLDDGNYVNDMTLWPLWSLGTSSATLLRGLGSTQSRSLCSGRALIPTSTFRVDMLGW